MAMIRQAVREEIMSHTRKDQKKARQVKTKVKSILIDFFDVKGIVFKEFLLAGQTDNSAYYCGVLRRLCDN
jgi:hypothetical protein